jgi:ferredoxin
MHTPQVPCIDMTKCTRCYKCIAVCPVEAIVIRKSSDDNFLCAKCVKYCLQFENMSCKPESVCIIFEKCNSCGACVAACDERAIRWIEQEKKR